MVYQSKKEQLRKSTYRFNHKLFDTVSKEIENPYTGIVVTTEENGEPRWCAFYETSQRSTIGLDNYSATYDLQVAVRKTADDNFDNLKQDPLKVWHIDDDMDSKYYIKNIQRATEPNGYHIITLTTKEQTGQE